MLNIYIYRCIYISLVVVFAMTMMLNFKSGARGHSTEDVHMWKQRGREGTWGVLEV